MSFRKSIIEAAAQRPGSRVEIDSHGRLNPATAPSFLLTVQDAAAIDVTTAAVGMNGQIGSLMPVKGESFKLLGETLLLHCSQAVPSISRSTEVETGALVEEFLLTNSALDGWRPADVIDGHLNESSVRMKIFVKISDKDVEQLGSVHIALGSSRQIESVDYAAHGYEPAIGVSDSGRLPIAHEARTELLKTIARPMMAARTKIANLGLNGFASSGQQLEMGINSKGTATLSSVGRSAGLASHGAGF